MLNLFLIWDLVITPIDKNIGVIKSNLDFNHLKSLSLKNEQITREITGTNNPNINEKNKNIDFYFFNDFIGEYKIKIRFFEVTNTPLLTNSILLESDILNDLFKRHNQIFNDLISGETGNKYFEYRMEKMAEKIEEKTFYNLRPITVPIKTKLFNYQINNINWMIDQEISPRNVRITDNRFVHIPDGRIFEYSPGRKFITEEDIPLIRVRGGIIADEVGKGKTIQILSLCFALNKPTIILVPNHLKSHWNNELSKHFHTIPQIIIITFDEFNINMLYGIKRLVIDEIHLLYSSPRYMEMFENLCNTGVEFKWGVSATPFAGRDNISSIVKYLLEIPIYYYYFERYICYTSFFESLFKRNVEKNISDELLLPPINQLNHFLNFSDNEMAVYMAEASAKENADEYDLRSFCCDTMLTFDNNFAITQAEFQKVHMSNFQKKLDEELSFLKELEEKLKIIMRQPITDELMKNKQHYENLIAQQVKSVKNRERPINMINSIFQDEKSCAICTEKIENSYCILKDCHHYFCQSCIVAWSSKSKICPMCRVNFTSNPPFFKLSDEVETRKYSTKFMELLKILAESSEQFIIFTQFPKIISKTISILRLEGISCDIFSDANIDKFRSNHFRVLILSSVDNSCGLDLSFVRNIIIFEPIKSDYILDIEKQIIGRIRRINQDKECNVHRLIIRDTIEEKIYRELLPN